MTGDEKPMPEALLSDDGFCPLCEIVLDLHGTDEPATDGADCESAAMKADLLGMFGRGMFGA